MKLTPVGDHIIVKAVKIEHTSPSGIIIPETVDKERPERGEVISVGPGKQLDNGTLSHMPCVPGQTVLFKKYAPDEIKVEGVEFLVIRSEDVIAIVE